MRMRLLPKPEAFSVLATVGLVLKGAFLVHGRLLLTLMAILALMANHSVAATIRIMPVGDSITAGTTDPNWTNPFSFAYRSSLYTKLNNASYDFQFVGDSPEPWNGQPFGVPPAIVGPDLRAVGQDGHRGYGGSSISNITNGSGYNPGIVAAMNADNPDLILLMIGINDLAGFGNGSNPVAAKSQLTNLTNLILATKPTVNLIVAQTNTYKDGSLANSTTAYNDYIRDTLVPSYVAQGYKVSTVDQYANFVKPDGTFDQSLYSNIIHPNAAGYDLMAQTWFDGIQAISPILPSPGPVVTGTLTEGVNPPVLPANNLIAQGSSAFSSSFSGGTAPAAFGAQLPGGMNNGVMTDADAAASTILAWDNVTTDFGWAVYELDTATNPLGYDVSEILSYAAWTGARVNQRVEIKYALVGETVTVGSELSNTLGTFSFAPSDNSTPYAYSTMSIAHNTDPTVLSGISAIQIKYLDNMFDGNTGSVVDPGNFTAYKQFAVIGTPTASSLSGDFDLDGDVDGADFLKWQRDLAPDSVSLAAWEAGFGTVSPLLAAATGVPEPTTLTCMMGLCLTSLWASARRKLFCREKHTVDEASKRQQETVIGQTLID